MNAAKHPLPGGDLELAVLAALWGRRGAPATARAIYEEVGEPRGLVYTTIAKVLDRLVDKGMVERRREGRAYVHEAIAERSSTERALARSMIEQIVGDDPRPAVAALVGAIEDVSPELLDELEAELRARRKRGDGT